MGLVGAGLVGDKIVNDFPLSTTAFPDGKGGFTSNERLNNAQTKAASYRAAYQAATPEARAAQGDPRFPLHLVGDNQFVTMTDFRAATKLHLADRMNTPEARASLMTSIECLLGQRVKPEKVAELQPSHVPAEYDLTKSSLFDKKNKYALAGVPNDQTGASGYTSRSLTQPFINKGMKDYTDETASRGLSPRQCLASLKSALEADPALGPEAQKAAGQLILNTRQVYADDAHWGHAERVVMPALKNQGLLLSAETDKLDATLLFEDPATSILKRNTSVAGPALHKLDTTLQEAKLRNNPEARADIMAMAKEKNMENLPIAHVKVNEKGTGFEDSSGLGDSFTSANAVACINHARLMSAEPPLSAFDAQVIVACLNAVYDDVSSVRHTMREIARGCYAGAGSTCDNADAFYADVCKSAAKEFYVGKALAQRSDETPPRPTP
ncbi:XopAG/AvrGf1 family type III secretion system effector [Hydrogenophaga soli]